MQKEKPLRVGIVFDDTLDSNDGVAQYVKGLGGWLSRHGHEVVYLVGQTKMEVWAGGKVCPLSKNIKVSFNGNKMSIPLPGKTSVIKSVLARENLDVVHVQIPYSPFMAQKVIKIARRNSVVVGTFHVFPASRLAVVGAKLLYLVQARSLKKFDRVLSVSSAAAKFAKDAFHLSTQPSSNIVDLAGFKQPPNASQAQHIVFLGRLVKRKGCQQLIEAFDLLQKKVPEARLTIAGDGPERAALQKIVKQKNLQDSIKFIGFIDEKDKPKLLASAAIACFPSLYGESFGIVLIEAMAAGAGIVLGGDNPGYRSVLGGQETLLVDPRNQTALADRLEHLLKDDKLARQLHNWQLEQVKQYDVNVVGRQILDIYNQEIAKKR